VLAVLLGHITNTPHTDPSNFQGADSGPPVVAILVGVVLTLATLAALIYLKQRMAEDDDEQSG
jgi:hypothetical protein